MERWRESRLEPFDARDIDIAAGYRSLPSLLEEMTEGTPGTAAKIEDMFVHERPVGREMSNDLTPGRRSEFLVACVGVSVRTTNASREFEGRQRWGSRWHRVRIDHTRKVAPDGGPVG